LTHSTRLLKPTGEPGKPVRWTLLLILLPTLSFAQSYKELSVSGNLSMGSVSGSDSTIQSAEGMAQTDLSVGFFIPQLALNPFGDPLYFLQRPNLGISAAAGGALSYSNCAECEVMGAIESEVVLSAIYVNGSAGLSYQAPVRLNQLFWRSTRGLEERRLGFHFPGLMSAEFEEDEYSIKFRLLGFDTTRTEVLLHHDNQLDHIGDDYRWFIHMFAFEYDRGEDQMAVHGVSYEIQYWIAPFRGTNARNEPIPLVRDYTAGANNVSGLQLTLMEVTRGSPGIGITRAHFGASMLKPLNSGKGDLNHITYTWALGIGQNGFDFRKTFWDGEKILTPRHGKWGWNAEISSFHRLSPTGLAVDHGERLRLDLSWAPINNLVTSITGTAIRAERVLVADEFKSLLAEVEAPLPFLMWRSEFNAAWKWHELSQFTFSAWAENTDRPTVFGTSGAQLGANLNLSFAY